MKWRLVLATAAVVSLPLTLAHVGATGRSPLIYSSACWAVEGEGDEPEPLAVGDEAPDFRLKDLKGKEFHLKAVLEKKAVLLAFFATWHPKSRNQIVSLKPVAEELKDQPLQILAIALDRGGKEVVGPFAKEQELNFPILLDSELATKDKYQIKATLPLVFVIGRDGKIKAMEKALDEEALRRLREAADTELERVRPIEESTESG